jgi:elastin
MRRIGIAAAILAAAGIGGTAVVTTTHAAGLPLPGLGGGGSGLPVVGGLPGLDGTDPVGTVIGAVAGMPGYVLNCGLMSNVPMLQHPATTTHSKSKRNKVKHTAPALPTCGNGLPVVSGLPVVGGIAGGLPTNGLGGVTGGLPVVGDGSALGGLPIGDLGSLAGGLPIGGIAGLAGGLPIGGLGGLTGGGLGGLSLGGLGLGG